MEGHENRVTGAKIMLNTRDATEVLERDFLESRCKILEVAAILDRIDRAPARHGEHPDARLAQLRSALEALLEPGPGRAETVQRIFSLEYDPRWRERMSMARPNSH
jgi:hypothetical protein